MKRHIECHPTHNKKVKLIESEHSPENSLIQDDSTRSTPPPCHRMCDGLIALLLSFIPFYDMVRLCGGVCERWIDIINDWYVKKKKIKIEANRVYALGKSRHSSHVIHLVIKSDYAICNDVSESLALSFPNLKNLRITGPLTPASLSGLANMRAQLEALTLDHSDYLILDSCTSAVSRYGYARQLVRAYCTLAESPKLSSLRSLRIFGYNFLRHFRKGGQAIMDSFLSSDHLSGLESLLLLCGRPNIDTIGRWFSEKDMPKLTELVIEGNSVLALCKEDRDPDTIIRESLQRRDTERASDRFEHNMIRALRSKPRMERIIMPPMKVIITKTDHCTKVNVDLMYMEGIQSSPSSILHITEFEIPGSHF